MFGWRTKVHNVIPSTITSAPDCFGCGRQMAIQPIVPKYGMLPELRRYDCEPCGIGVTEEVEPANLADAILQKAVRLRTGMERLASAVETEDFWETAESD